MNIKKATIIGKGAIGLLYGDMIARNIGADAVEFAMDDERFARHRGEVLTVNGAPCEVATVPMSEAAPADLVILACKATGLADAIETMEPLVGPETLIVSLLNGITSEERVGVRYGAERLVLSICQGMDAVFLDGALTYSRAGEIRFGAGEATVPGAVEAIADFFTRAGIPHVVEADARRRMWVKLMLNVGVNQTCMAYGGTYGTVTQAGSEQQRCFVAAMREALAVGRAEGVDIREEDLAQMYRLMTTLDPAGMPSMAQDRIARRATEVEEFSGEIRRRAGKHGILVPTNDWLYRRIREIEASW